MLPWPVLVPFRTSKASQLHVNPPNEVSQTLRLQGGAAPHTSEKNHFSKSTSIAFLLYSHQILINFQYLNSYV